MEVKYAEKGYPAMKKKMWGLFLCTAFQGSCQGILTGEGIPGLNFFSSAQFDGWVVGLKDRFAWFGDKMLHYFNTD